MHDVVPTWNNSGKIHFHFLNGLNYALNMHIYFSVVPGSIRNVVVVVAIVIIMVTSCVHHLCILELKPYACVMRTAYPRGLPAKRSRHS